MLFLSTRLPLLTLIVITIYGIPKLRFAYYLYTICAQYYSNVRGRFTARPVIERRFLCDKEDANYLVWPRLDSVKTEAQTLVAIEPGLRGR